MKIVFASWINWLYKESLYFEKIFTFSSIGYTKNSLGIFGLFLSFWSNVSEYVILITNPKSSKFLLYLEEPYKSTIELDIEASNFFPIILF